MILEGRHPEPGAAVQTYRKQAKAQGVKSWLPESGYLRWAKVPFHLNTTGRRYHELDVTE